MFRFIERIKHKLISPKIYAVVMTAPMGHEFLHLCAAYSLDEAVADAWKEMAKKHKEEHEHGTDCDFNERAFRLTMFISDSAESLMQGFTHATVEEAAQTEGVNQLMKRILDTGDASLIKRHQKTLGEKNVKYLEEKLGISKQ